MSRMYNQTGNLYKGVFDCLAKTIRTEGLLAIYKGYFAHLARILPHTVRSLSGILQTDTNQPADPDSQFGRANQQADAPGRGQAPLRFA